MLLGCRCSSGRPPGRFQLRTAAEMAARGHLRATNWTCFPRAVRPGWRPGIMHHIYAPSGRGSLSCSPTPRAGAGRCWLTSMAMGHRALTCQMSAVTSADMDDRGFMGRNSLDLGAVVCVAGTMMALLLCPSQVAGLVTATSAAGLLRARTTRLSSMSSATRKTHRHQRRRRLARRYKLLLLLLLLPTRAASSSPSAFLAP
jgi:hypothetical protein